MPRRTERSIWSLPSTTGGDFRLGVVGTWVWSIVWCICGLAVTENRAIAQSELWPIVSELGVGPPDFTDRSQASEPQRRLLLPIIELRLDAAARVYDEDAPAGLQPLPPVTESADAVGESLEIEEPADEAVVFPEFGYRGAGQNRNGGWLIGQGNTMGIFTLSPLEVRQFETQNHYVTFDWAIHWFMGPRATDMPPRLYDFLIRWGHQGTFTERFGYDLACTIGIYSDFEGSARQGLRCPSTAVLYYRSDERLQWLLGIDILNRDDFFCLPVAGAVWTPQPDLRFDLVFPKPRVAVRTPRLGWIYVGGEMGGGMWAVERMTGIDDVVTYRDFRAVVGINADSERKVTFFAQVGVSFARHLEFRSGLGDYDPHSGVFVQLAALF